MSEILNDDDYCNRHNLVVQSGGEAGLPAKLDAARQALAEATTDFDRIKVRDHAAAVQAAAAILNRRDIQVEASILVTEAERAIAKANPPAPPGRGKKVDPGSTISKPVRQKIRQTHAPITDPEFDQVKEQAREQGEPITRKALKDLGREKRKVQQVAKRKAKQAESLAADPGPDGRVFDCRCSALAGYVDAGTLDAIFTDPPYVEAGIPTYSELAAFAVHALRPGGLLLTMASHFYLPETLRRMEVEGLKWRWIVALVWQHNREQFHAAKVSIGWKPLLAYTREGGHPDFYSHDSFRAPPKEKDSQDAHHWGQSLGDCRMIAKEWLRPGWKVADPFCGSGSLMVAAKKMGCSVVGCDIEAAHVATTRGRLAA